MNHTQSSHRTEMDQCQNTTSCGPGTILPVGTSSGNKPVGMTTQQSINYFPKLKLQRTEDK